MSWPTLFLKAVENHFVNMLNGIEIVKRRKDKVPPRV